MRTHLPAPPSGDDAAPLIDALRADLQAADWGVEQVAQLLGEEAEAALRRELRIPALLRIRQVLAQEPSPSAILTGLFMLGEPMSASQIATALPHVGVDGALALRLISPHPGATDRYQPAIDLRPHEMSDDSGEQRWWVASDVGELVSGQALAADHVLGIGGAGLTLAGLTPREAVDTALDMGCGCGIQTLYLTRHARHVIATDISQRALDITAFNLALAGIGPERVSLRRGSFFEPVAGEMVDLIVSNPPFVITPPAVREAGLGTMEYRDSGMGRAIMPELVAQLAEHLTPGGRVVMLGNWEISHDDWRDDVRAWLPDCLDTWIIQREQQDRAEYAAMWLRDGGLTVERDRDTFDSALAAWVEDFRSRGVRGVGFGYLIAQRPETVLSAGSASGGGPGSPLGAEAPRSTWQICEEVTTNGQGPLGAHVAQVLEQYSRISGMDDDAVAASQPILASDVTDERHFQPGHSDPSIILLTQGAGFGRRIHVGTAESAFAGAADGELSVAQIAIALAALTGADAAQMREELVAATRLLVRTGMMRLPDGAAQA